MLILVSPCKVRCQSFDAIPRLLEVGDELRYVHVVKASPDLTKVSEQLHRREVIETHRLAFDLGNPFVVD